MIYRRSLKYIKNLPSYQDCKIIEVTWQLRPMQLKMLKHQNNKAEENFKLLGILENSTNLDKIKN